MQKAVVVTGASQGLGAAIAREFSQKNWFVFLLGRNPQNLDLVAKSCPHSHVLLCDLTIPTQVESAAANLKAILVQKNLRLEALINNAGIFAMHSVETGTDALWLQQFQVNMMGPVRITRALWPLFKEQKSGAIVNVSSTLGLKPTAQTAAYSASKAAMINWTVALAQEGGPLGIRANCLCPGIVDTPIHGFHTLPAEQKSAAVKGMSSLQPLGRIGQPIDIAPAAYFLASEASAWTTGATLNVDGGIHIV